MGKVICAGLGPGDPDLMSVKSDRIIRGAQHLAFFRKKGRAGQARTIVNGMLRDDVVEYPMEYPVTTELRFDSDEYRRLMVDFYAEWADRLAELAQEHDVVVLCEGDPFFYGSFMHLHTRLQGRAEVEVLPAIPGMVGCWNALDTPFTWGDDVMTVLMATLPDDELVAHMARADALVVMKTGRNMPRVRRALEAVGRLEDAWLVEKGTMQGQRVAKLADVDAEDCPYFAIVLVHGQGRRPEAAA
ncbi:MAG: precorrin-2/cobalt-factor-2 C20-methyltransferase [Sulfitobacter sp.]|jgi:precorrin-2/cobalt-factor-2 C20-methyltransferase